MLARAIVVQRRGRSARRAQAQLSRRGRSANASRIPARSRPARRAASIDAASSTCAVSPRCEAQASASSLSPKPSASAAPLSTSGSAWIAFTAERGKTGCATSPISSSVLPVASQTATAPRCALSTCSPRNISTRTGLATTLSSFYWSNASNSTFRNPWSGSPFATFANNMSSISSRPLRAPASRRPSSWRSAFQEKHSRSPTRCGPDFSVILPTSQTWRNVRKGLIGNAVAEGRLLVRRRLGDHVVARLGLVDDLDQRGRQQRERRRLVVDQPCLAEGFPDGSRIVRRKSAACKRCGEQGNR